MSNPTTFVIVVILWFLISIVGFLYNLANLIDSVRVLHWQEASKINGMRHLLAVGHRRTAILRTIEFGAAILIGIIGTLKPPGVEWVNVILLFALVGGVSVASTMDRRDRRKVTGE